MRYESYSTTDIPWVDEMPSHWNCFRGKKIFYNSKNKNDGNQESNLLSLTLRGVIRNNKDKPIGLSPADYATYQIFEKDDLVFKMIDLENISTSRVGIVPERGIMSSAYIRFTARSNVNIRYFYLQYYSWWLRNIYNGLGAGVRQTLSAEDLINLKILIPPREEQDQIVRYLDWKVSQINKLIHGYQKQIRFLSEKMQYIICLAVLHGLNKEVETKQVDIQNITEIPAHWSVLQNKRIFAERSEFSETGTETLLSVSKHFGVKPYYDLDDSEKFATIKPADSLIGYKKVMKNDLAMNIMRARNGSFGVSEYNGIVSPAYAVYRPIINCNPKYLHYLLRTPHVIGIFESYSYGIAEHRRRLYPFDFLRLYLPVPPKSEQDEIVEFIKSEQMGTQKIISSIQKEIDLLREYRTRLISDVVTGQMDVRGIEIPDYEPEESIPDEIEADEELPEEEESDE